MHTLKTGISVYIRKITVIFIYLYISCISGAAKEISLHISSKTVLIVVLKDNVKDTVRSFNAEKL